MRNLLGFFRKRDLDQRVSVAEDVIKAQEEGTEQIASDIRSVLGIFMTVPFWSIPSDRVLRKFGGDVERMNRALSFLKRRGLVQFGGDEISFSPRLFACDGCAYLVQGGLHSPRRCDRLGKDLTFGFRRKCAFCRPKELGDVL